MSWLGRPAHFIWCALELVDQFQLYELRWVYSEYSRIQLVRFFFLLNCHPHRQHGCVIQHILTNHFLSIQVRNSNEMNLKISNYFHRFIDLLIELKNKRIQENKKNHFCVLSDSPYLNHTIDRSSLVIIVDKFSHRKSKNESNRFFNDFFRRKSQTNGCVQSMIGAFSNEIKKNWVQQFTSSNFRLSIRTVQCQINDSR